MISPVLHVTDVDKSIKFYTERMGFTLSQKLPGPNGKTMLGDLSFRDLRIILRASASHRQGSEVEIVLDPEVNIEKLYTQMRMRGVVMCRDLEEKSWCERSFVARDPDGILLRFVRNTAPMMQAAS